uniref:Uncharacterized protein n=1 Tax=Anguilla anguilla TaxID=7936 RepID=A0A0E9QHI7_ANGAN
MFKLSAVHYGGEQM